MGRVSLQGGIMLKIVCLCVSVCVCLCVCVRSGYTGTGTDRNGCSDFISWKIHGENSEFHINKCLSVCLSVCLSEYIRGCLSVIIYRDNIP